MPGPANLSTPLQTRIFSDFNIDFIPNPITGDLLKVTGVNSVIQSIANLVQTNHYERPFHPPIGGNVRKLLFDLLSPLTAQLISEEIKDVLANYEPRAVVQDVIVATNAQLNGYNVTIVFTVSGGVSTPISISVFLQRLR
jgi:phage baseplate assembly protein W